MDRNHTEAALRVDIGRPGLTLPSMLVRICLLVVLAVAMATGCATTGDVTDDAQAELAELGVEEAVLARAVELVTPPASPVAPLVRTTELEPPIRFVGGVFRPPRVAFASI